jgi:hypothetical protein
MWNESANHLRARAEARIAELERESATRRRYELWLDQIGQLLDCGRADAPQKVADMVARAEAAEREAVEQEIAWNAALEEAMRQRDEAEADLRVLREVRAPGTCQCSDEEACRFVRERDSAQARAKWIYESLGANDDEIEQVIDKLKAERDEALATLDVEKQHLLRAFDSSAEWERRCKDARKERANLLDLLRRVEWVGFDYVPHMCECPCCYHKRHEGHAPGCELARALQVDRASTAGKDGGM